MRQHWHRNKLPSPYSAGLKPETVARWFECFTWNTIRFMRGFTCLCVALLLISGWTGAAGQTTPSVPPRPLSVNGQALPSGAVGEGYSFQLTVNGGTPPVLWQLVQGSLPPGIQLDESSGLLSGMPRSTGEFRFILAATDSSTPRSVARAEFDTEDQPGAHDRLESRARRAERHHLRAARSVQQFEREP